MGRKFYFGKFQGQVFIPRKMVMYSLSKFDILKPCAPVFNCSEQSIQTFGKFQSKFIGNCNILRKFFQSFKVCLAFPENPFCIRRPNFAFLSLAPISHHSEDSIQALDRLQNKIIGNSNMGRLFKICLKFQGLPRFPRKIILYSSSKFGIFQPCNNI